ncbi:MAG: xanthine dehydrogenase family protein molybdopterin-binding subunit [Candidatus Hydrogenedentes bacterium]|nr:xanthine dehydrogenase family protein molybdopterin-binding subunit [Candidatus Hydrogenedentota bacterium]
MAKLAWPGPDRRKNIGARISRLDGPEKTTGTAKYSYDMNREGMLYAKLYQSPHAIAKVTAVDTSEAEAMPGVKGVYIEKDRRGEFPNITYAGDIICAIAATSEEIADEALTKVKVSYSDIGSPQMNDNDPSLISGRDQSKEQGDPDAGFGEADAVSEGTYGLACITHACLESHGQMAEFKDGELYVWPSTQNVSGYAGGLARAAELSADKIHVECQYMGGGFGSKFGADKWGSISTILSKQTAKPVKLMLERDQEHKVAGHRPSAFGTVKIGVKKDGTITAWDSDIWGSGGMGNFRMPPLPYVFTGLPNYRTLGRGIKVNRGAARAWRGPNHPQAALITMCALDDAAHAIGMDSLSFFKKNLHLTDRPEVYAEELDKAAEMIDWKGKWHPRGENTGGSMRSGLGLSIHTWGGGGGQSDCAVTINPDGSVVGRTGTQDLGTGTRTVQAIVLSDTLGLPVDKVRIEIGKNSLPASGASGGSTTVGGVSSSTRDAATQALNALLEKVAPDLGVEADKLEAWDGRIQEIGNPSKGMSWEQACSLLGGMAITKQGSKDTSDGTILTVSGVGGVGIADVTVDIETGMVTINEYAAVQDCGLIIDEKTCESQLYGGTIMGITYALYEETVYDPATGAMLNPDFEFYKIAGLADVGKIKVHLMRGPKYEDRGVVGIGEPAVISQGAAIANAVANAIGVRVPELPLTPDRVLDAISKGGVA